MKALLRWSLHVWQWWTVPSLIYSLVWLKRCRLRASAACHVINRAMPLTATSPCHTLLLLLCHSLQSVHRCGARKTTVLLHPLMASRKDSRTSAFTSGPEARMPPMPPMPMPMPPNMVLNT